MSSSVAITNFADLSFVGVTLTARGALIYNTTTDGGSGTTDAVCVLDFGGNKNCYSWNIYNSVSSIYNVCSNIKISIGRVYGSNHK